MRVTRGEFSEWCYASADHRGGCALCHTAMKSLALTPPLLPCRREAFVTNAVKLLQPISSVRVIVGSAEASGGDVGSPSAAGEQHGASCVELPGECPGPITRHLLQLVREALPNSLSPSFVTRRSR